MKQHDRGRAGLRVLVALVLCVTTAAVSAQQYPSKPVRVIVPLAPGGGSDITARHFSAKLAEILGQPFIVDNRGGAGGLIGMELTAKAPPDGYTLMMQGGGVASVPATQKTAWDPLSAIIPIMEFGVTPFILTVHPSVPAASTKELIALARAKPGAITYASAGIGGITHLATALFANMAKIKMIHVPYKSTGAAMADLLSGQVSFIVGSLLPMVPHVRSGKLRPLAVTTAKRWYSMPDVPAVAETVPGYEVELSFGTLAPRGTPRPIIERLNAALNKALDQQDTKKYLEREGMVPTGGPPEHYGNRIRRDYERWSKVVKEANIRVE